MRRFSALGTIAVLITFIVSLSWLGLSLIGRSFVDEGESDVVVSGLGDVVVITRDGYGVPYVQAGTEEDAWTAVGFAQAQDRLWQMDLSRRAAQGRLSEIFGRRALDYDRLMRTVGITRVAMRIVHDMPAATKRALEAYARGVNAYIRENRGRYAFEFDALGYEPEEWSPVHSVMVVRMLGWELNSSLWTDVVYEELKNHVDSIRFKQALPYYPSDAPTIIPGGQRPEPLNSATKPSLRPDSLQTQPTATPATFREHSPSDRTAIPEGMTGRLMDIDRSGRDMIGIGGPMIGSNAWVLGPERTASGKPMLANDPHLPHSVPCKWYQCVVLYPGNVLAGVMVPGIPFIVSGRTSRVAWGVTAMMADQTDFYHEKLDSTGRLGALHDGRFEKLTIVRDTIVVKDSASVPIVVRLTRHGPLISDVDPWQAIGRRSTSPSAAGASGTALSLRWAGADPTQELAALHGMNRAHDLTSFAASTRLGGVPGISVVYADTTGTIAYVPSAAIPMREAVLLPRPGWESRFNWKGTYPIEQIPLYRNPASGYIASANNKVSNSFPVHVGDLWEDPSRAVRLEELLTSGDGVQVTDFIQIQADLLSPHMRYLVEYLVRAFPDSARQGSAVRQALGLLRTWDAGMREDEPAAAIAAMWLQSVIEATYRDDMGEDIYRRWCYLSLNPVRAIRHHVMIDSHWFDNVNTHDRVERRDDILRRSLGVALDSLHRRFDTWDIARWRYGALHMLTFRHPFSQQKEVRDIVDIGAFEIGGANGTINNGEWDFARPFEVRVGPTMRQIIDLGDTSAYVRSVITSGESGQPLNGFYSNQTVLWLSNGYIALNKTAPTGADVSSTTRLRRAIDE